MMNSSYGRRRRRAAGLSNYGSNQASHAGGFASSHGRIPNSTAGTDCSPPPGQHLAIQPYAVRHRAGGGGGGGWQARPESASGTCQPAVARPRHFVPSQVPRRRADGGSGFRPHGRAPPFAGCAVRVMAVGKDRSILLAATVMTQGAVL
uniref:Uncharacterized protein n=1 Tax=Oryza rufipogon TaxID=4529 RepID=A0A0E0N3K6_ORYRU